MKLLREGLFLDEIVFQAQLARLGAERLEVAVNENYNKLEIWSAIQLILNSAANISKILWPKKQYKERGAYLRKRLNVDEDNILRNRDFRNKLEHYDDLIDEFFENHGSGSYFDFVMNPSMQSFGLKQCNRGYNTFNNTVVIRGEILDLNAVLNAIKELESRC